MVLIKRNKYYLIITFIITLTIALLCNGLYAFAQSNSDEFVELEYNINSKIYSSMHYTKTVDEAPFIEDGVVMIPLKNIFTELGYNTTWSDKNSSLTCTKDNNVIKITANSKTIYFNQTEKKLETAPRLVNKVLVGPIGIISTYCRTSIIYDEEAKTVEVIRTGKFNTGSVMFYEKSKSRVLVYDGDKLKVYPLVNKEIINWYSHKGQILLTIFDKEKSKNNFVTYKNNKFEVLIDDFDIKEAFVYNDNLIIHGYDRTQKINKLYRFDGNKLTLIADNFYVGNYTIFKEKLIINKYDNTRNYTLLTFDKSSWTPSILSDDFIIKDVLDCGDILFMTGVRETGTDKPLASYDGETITKSSFKIVNDNIDVNLKNTVLCNGKLYAILNGEITQIEKNTASSLKIPVDNGTAYNVYIANNIKSYNNAIYIAVTGAKYFSSNGVEDRNKYSSRRYLLQVKNTNDKKILIDNIDISDIRVENNKLIILGVDGYKKDNVLYVYDGDYLTKTFDVTKIKNTISVGKKTIIDVNDRDRIKDKGRNTVLIYDNNGLRNMVVGIDMKNWSVIGQCMVFGGIEEDMNRNKVYSYKSKFKELLSNFDIRYWNVFGQKVFINGYNPNTGVSSLYKVLSGNKIKISDNIEIINMVKAKGSYYIVYAMDKEPKSALNGTKILYIYNDSYKTFAKIKLDLELSDMIFIK